jgi:hypothetical protein
MKLVANERSTYIKNTKEQISKTSEAQKSRGEKKTIRKERVQGETRDIVKPDSLPGVGEVARGLKDRRGWKCGEKVHQ